jgi:DNA-binding LacI/PurR family transcriptional regulator
MSQPVTSGAAPGRGRPRRPAGTDVARVAGVSQKTVSRVMNNEPLVSDEVRRRVLKAAAELDYRPSSAARALNSGRTRHIGYVSLGTALHGPVATLVATERAARSRGFSLGITTTAEGADGIAEAINAVLQEGAEGIVISEPIDTGAVELSVAVPVLVFGYMPGLDAPRVISALTSGDRYAADATDYLLSLGHETVHHVAGPASWFASRERVAGWSRTLRARHAREIAPLHGDWTAASGYEAGRRLARDRSVTAVFAANDDMAIGVIRALVEAGRSVPRDVSVLGFDDIPAAAYVSPSLTTFRYPFEAGAARGVAALVGAIEHPDVPPQALEDPPGELVIRESTAPPIGGGRSARNVGGDAAK